MQYVVVETQPDKTVTVYGPFAFERDARVYAQTMHDWTIEDGPGFRYKVTALETPRQ